MNLKGKYYCYKESTQGQQKLPFLACSMAGSITTTEDNLRTDMGLWYKRKQSDKR